MTNEPFHLRCLYPVDTLYNPCPIGHAEKHILIIITHPRYLASLNHHFVTSLSNCKFLTDLLISFGEMRSFYGISFRVLKRDLSGITCGANVHFHLLISLIVFYFQYIKHLLFVSPTFS